MAPSLGPSQAARYAHDITFTDKIKILTEKILLTLKRIFLISTSKILFEFNF